MENQLLTRWFLHICNCWQECRLPKDCRMFWKSIKSFSFHNPLSRRNAIHKFNSSNIYLKFITSIFFSLDPVRFQRYTTIFSRYDLIFFNFSLSISEMWCSRSELFSNTFQNPIYLTFLIRYFLTCRSRDMRSPSCGSFSEEIPIFLHIWVAELPHLISKNRSSGH